MSRDTASDIVVLVIAIVGLLLLSASAACEHDARFCSPIWEGV